MFFMKETTYGCHITNRYYLRSKDLCIGEAIQYIEASKLVRKFVTLKNPYFESFSDSILLVIYPKFLNCYSIIFK